MRKYYLWMWVSKRVERHVKVQRGILKKGVLISQSPISFQVVEARSREDVQMSNVIGGMQGVRRGFMHAPLFAHMQIISVIAPRKQKEKQTRRTVRIFYDANASTR